MTKLAPVPAIPASAGENAWREVAAELCSIGFTEGNLHRMSASVPGFQFSFDQPISFSPGHRSPAIGENRRLSRLIRFFQEGEPLSASAMSETLSTRTISFLEEAALISRQGGDFLASVSLVLWKGVWLASDRYDGDEDPAYVFQPSGSTSITEALFPIMTPGRRAIDIGAGCGVLSILLQQRQSHCTAVDLNPRACEFVRLSYSLNGMPLPEVRCASHEVLDEDRWDFVAFNMPYTYRTGDALAVAYKEESRGLSIVRDVYRSLARPSSRRRLAILRHDMKLSAFTSEGFLREVGEPEGLQILYIPRDEETSRLMVPSLGKVDFRLGAALVRTLPAPDSPRVSFLSPLTVDDGEHFSVRRIWRRILATPGWEDAAAF
jgi:hypothetical protein